MHARSRHSPEARYVHGVYIICWPRCQMADWRPQLLVRTLAVGVELKPLSPRCNFHGGRCRCWQTLLTHPASLVAYLSGPHDCHHSRPLRPCQPHAATAQGLRGAHNGHLPPHIAFWHLRALHFCKSRTSVNTQHARRSMPAPPASSSQVHSAANALGEATSRVLPTPCLIAEPCFETTAPLFLLFLLSPDPDRQLNRAAAPVWSTGIVHQIPLDMQSSI